MVKRSISYNGSYISETVRGRVKQLMYVIPNFLNVSHFENLLNLENMVLLHIMTSVILNICPFSFINTFSFLDIEIGGSGCPYDYFKYAIVAIYTSITHPLVCE